MSFVDTTTTDAGQADLGTQATVTPEAYAEGSATPEAPSRYPVKIHGVEMEVTLEEALSGYMRQQDYSRKTQALATQKQELAQAEALTMALKRDPAGTLAALAEQFGVTELASEDDDDPYRGKFRSLEEEIKSLRLDVVQRQIDREVSQVKDRYGADDAQVEEAMAFAAQNGVTLLTAYRDIFFDDVFEVSKTARQRKLAEADIAAQKANAGVVHLGTSSAGSTATKVVERPKTVREAYLLAQQGVRIQD